MATTETTSISDRGRPILENHYRPISDGDYTEWLQSAAVRFPVVLVEATHSIEQYVTLDGTDDHLTTADVAGFAMTGLTQTLIVEVNANDYSPTADEYIASQYDYGASQASWGMFIDTTGKIGISYSVDGSTLVSSLTSVIPSLTDGVRYLFKFYRVAATGVWQISFKLTIDDEWVQIGADIAGTTGALHDSTANMLIGAQLNSGADENNLAGAVYSMWIYDDTRLISSFPDTGTWTEVSGAVISSATETEYMGTHPYISSVYDTNANRYYEDILISDLVIDQRLDRIVIGDLSVINDGYHTDWLAMNWKGHTLKVLFGDLRWRLNDFRTVIDGKNKGISAPKSNRYRFGVADFSDVLRGEVGTELSPLCYGKCYNVRPALTDAGALTYKVHTGTVTSIVVRDNGIVLTGGGVGYTADLTNGEFDLTSAPSGQITVDVVQTDVTVSAIITALVALSAETISVNTTNFSAFPNTSDMGIYVDSSTPLNTLLTDLLLSLGSGFRFNTLGEIELYRLDTPNTSILSVTPDDIKQFGITHRGVEEPTLELSLGYQKNWHVQSGDGLAGAVGAQDREDFSTDYEYVKLKNGVSEYPLAVDAEKLTLIYNLADAETEATRLQNIRSIKREIYRVKSFLAAGVVSLGDTVNIKYSDYGFDEGVDVVIIGINRSLGKGSVTLMVWK